MKRPKLFEMKIGALCGLITLGPTASILAKTSPAGSSGESPYSGVSYIEIQNDEPDDIANFIGVQTQIAEEILGDASEASTAYILSEFPDERGSHPCTSYFGTEVDLQIIYLVDPDIMANDPDLFLTGFDARMVIGKLVGPVGDVKVVGMAFNPGGVTPDTDILFVPSAILSDSDYAIYQRAVSLESRRFYPSGASPSSPTPPAIAEGSTVYTFDDDPSTVFVDTPDTGGSPSTILDDGETAACIRAAYAIYDIDVNAAEASVAVCVLAITLGWVACTSTCIALVLIPPPLSFAATAVCVLGCLSAQAIGYVACAANYAISLHAADLRLRVALQACGVIIAEQ